ncbi:hypothetical protein ASE01_02690 [Nocardioides sp. Root190]|uniref:hypothetical protein n=1 Tax=Nocardioides sp. Root190 TaxID=1736488 RepID=UPI0006F8A34D|nr:hypothetical protein [Nocardioides sp. Root190]KRB80397.1 hypothetical protein ASE01_02690 [Nocardioides sp. Root190]
MTLTDHRGTVDADPASIRGDYVTLRVALLLVGSYVVFGLLGFAVFAGFWPPPGEDWTANEIHAYFVDHQTGLTLGMVMMAFAGPFYVTWSVAISKVIGRIEGPMGPLAGIQVIGGLLTGLVTFVPATIWITASFRVEERSPEMVQTLYDFGWMFFDTTFVCSALQSVAIGVAILRDRRTVSLYPRWFAYLSFFTAFCYVPLTVMPFVKTGLFAWHGGISFWVVFVEFFVFTALGTWFTWKALHRLEAEDLAVAAG